MKYLERGKIKETGKKNILEIAPFYCYFKSSSKFPGELIDGFQS